MRIYRFYSRRIGLLSWFSSAVFNPCLVYWQLAVDDIRQLMVLYRILGCVRETFYKSVNFCPAPCLQERESEVGLVEIVCFCSSGEGGGKGGGILCD
jgi:hypothetical protein